MNFKRLLATLAVCLLALPAIALAQPPDPADSVIVESKVAAPVAGACASAGVKVRVWITNKDSLGNVTLPFVSTSISGGAYSILSRPASCAARTSPAVFDFLYPPAPSTTPRLPTRVPNFANYHSNSPDSYMFTGTFDPTDDDTKVPPGGRTAFIDIKHDSCANLGLMDIDSVRILTNTIQFVNTAGGTVRVNFVKGGVTQSVPPPVITNCAGASGSTLYGRPYNYNFTADKPVIWSVSSGPGSITPGGNYTFNGQCPLDLVGIPVQVRACDQANPNVCGVCNFTIIVNDNPPFCSAPNVTVSHGALATNTITAGDPDPGDGVIIAQQSGPGATVGNQWSYQTSCQDVGASPQTVQHMVTDFFQNCNPGPLSATCSFTLNVTNANPSINCPPNATVQAGNPYNACPSASDADPADQGNLTYALCGGPAGMTIDPSTGCVSWAPTAGDVGCHPVCIQVTDLCGASSQCNYTVCVVSGQMFKLCIETVHPPFQGGDVTVCINNLVEAFDPTCGPNGTGCVGGFSLLLSYDCSCLQFISASKGQLLKDQNWEFFTYRFGALGNGNCGSGCPDCLIRIVAIADINNSNIHPAPCPRENLGQWVCLKFRTSSNLQLAGLCCPINFHWFDCNDNTVSDASGNCLWTACSLLTPDGTPIDLETAFPTVNVEACTTFSGGPGKPKPKCFIIFCNGKICLPPLESLDARGDINLNGLGHEIADAVLFENYFIYGPGVFVINVPGQTAASDVNGDGRPLTVADLVLLIRVITGDANPLPKALPGAVVNLAMDANLSEVNLSASSASEIGGLYLKFKVNGTVGTPVLSEAAEGMTMKTNLVGDELSVLIFTDENHKGTSIAPNAGKILTIPVTGSVELVETDASNYIGASVPTLSKGTPIPSGFSLSQNFPNPFNPKTSFVLALPVASEYSVTIYNVAGQVVKSFSGSAAAGNKVITWDGTDNNGTVVSSGIYFYKAEAGKFVDKKKMILMR